MNQRRYETLFLLHPDLSEEEIKKIEEKCVNIINETQGKLLKLDEWGYRKLAYEIKGQTRGFYFLLDYAGSPNMLAELERQMRIDERVFRYLSLILEREFDEEKYQQELARREAETKRAKEEAEARLEESEDQFAPEEGLKQTKDAAVSISNETPGGQAETPEPMDSEEKEEASSEDKPALQTETSSESVSETEKAKDATVS